MHILYKIAAADFIRCLLRRSNELGELCVDSAAEFVNECFLAIGFNCSITPRQISARSYSWPQIEMSIYSFHHNKLEFNRFERFLTYSSAVIDDCQSLYTQQHNLQSAANETDGCEEEDSPIQLWMQLISIWCNASRHLSAVAACEANKRFEEPLARINYHLLLGLHELRKSHRQQFPILDSICHRLFCNAIQGLYYKETHNLVLDGMLSILNRDMHCFAQPLTDIFNFYYQAFSVDNMPQTYSKVYAHLLNILKNMIVFSNDGIEEVYSSLIDYLIQPHMLEVYFTTLKQNGKPFENQKLMAVLFLQELQARILTVDCFNRRFVEAIFHLSGGRNEKLGDAAAQLYITVMRKKVNNVYIVRHIIDAYMRKLSGSASLKVYIEKLYKHFDYLGIYKNYIEIILDNDTPLLLRTFFAYIVLIVFHIDVTQHAQARRNDIEHLLLILPDVLENIENEQIIGTLLQLYNIYDTSKWNNEIYNNFIHYAIGVFHNLENHYNYTLLMNIFVQFDKCQRQLQLYDNFNSLWDHVQLQLQHFNNNLAEKHIDLTDRFLMSYSDILKRLNILLKIDHPIQQNLNTIAKDLLMQFTTNSNQQQQLMSDQYHMDVYALEAVNSCIMKLYNTEEEHQRELALEYAQLLRTFIWNNMKSINIYLKYPIRRIEMYFVVLIVLHCALPLQMPTDVYKYLVKVLTSSVLANNIRNVKKYILPQDGINSRNVINIQKQMIHRFVQLHTVTQIKIDTNTAWKLCIHYHSPRCRYSSELKALIIALAKHHFKLYKQMIPVVIYNLFHMRPRNKPIQNLRIIREHRRLIFEEIALAKPELMCIHIVLVVLEMMQQAVKVQPKKSPNNRLEGINHLSALIEGFDLQQMQVARLIEQEIRKFDDLILNSNERQSLKAFKKHLLTSNYLRNKSGK